MSANLTELESATLLAWKHTNEANNVLSFRRVASRSTTPLHSARRAVRALARKGMVEYSIGYTDDGGLCGAGYFPTVAGLQMLEVPAK